MPFIRITTSMTIAEDQRLALLEAASKLIAECIGKPEQYVMGSLATEPMIMSGKPGNTAFAEVRSIGGLNDRVNNRIAQDLGKLLHEFLGVPPERVYTNFVDVSASDWAWRGETFG